MSERPRQLKLNRETVRHLSDVELDRVLGGQNQTAGTCPVTACICVTGVICRDLTIRYC